MAIDINLTEGITQAFSLITSAIAVCMTPPLVYFVSISFAVIALKLVWKFLKPRIGRG